MSENRCKVYHDDEIYEGKEYVAIIPKDNGDAGFYYNTDALSMGMAMQLCAKAFATMLNQLDEMEREEIHKILGGSCDE